MRFLSSVLMIFFMLPVQAEEVLPNSEEKIRADVSEWFTLFEKGKIPQHEREKMIGDVLVSYQNGLNMASDTLKRAKVRIAESDALSQKLYAEIQTKVADLESQLINAKWDISRERDLKEFIERIRQNTYRSRGVVLGLRLAGDGRFDEVNVQGIYREASLCLLAESFLRKSWKRFAANEMYQKDRDEIGRLWAVMVEITDEISGLIDKNRNYLDENVLRFRKSREDAKAAPRPPEPKIIEE